MIGDEHVQWCAKRWGRPLTDLEALLVRVVCALHRCTPDDLSAFRGLVPRIRHLRRFRGPMVSVRVGISFGTNGLIPELTRLAFVAHDLGAVVRVYPSAGLLRIEVGQGTRPEPGEPWCSGPPTLADAVAQWRIEHPLSDTEVPRGDLA
jgi:hypothetical protein